MSLLSALIRNSVFRWQEKREGRKKVLARYRHKEVSIRNIQCEITNHCNFHCSFCPSDELERPKKHMPVELFESIVEQINEIPSIRRMTLNVLGEPLVHPQFHDILDVIVKRRRPIWLFTNGALFTDERIQKTVEQLASFEGNNIEISLHAPSEEQYYAQRRTDFPFEKYIAQIRKVVKAVRAVSQAGKSLSLTLQIADDNKAIIDTTFTTSFQKMYDEYAELFGLPRMVLPKQFGYIDVIDGIKVRVRPLDTYGGQMVSAGFHMIPRYGAFCEIPFEALVIYSDGRVGPCCWDSEGELSFGSVLERPLLDIIAGPLYMRLIKDFQKGYLRHSVCQRCKGTLAYEAY